MAKRKGLSTKLRFEIFKRDSFKCQYCGMSAPTVILNVDHIKPVSKGGKNDILNLITSCFDCNSGKSDRIISDNSAVTLQKQQLDELNERRQQLTMLIEWKTLLEDKSYEIDSILKYFNSKFDTSLSLTDFGKKELSVLIKKYPTDEILESINYVYDKHFGSDMELVGIWCQIPRVIKFVSANENDRNKMKFFGGIKGRFNGTTGYSQWNTISTNRYIKALYQIIDEGGSNLTYGSLFKILNNHRYYDDFTAEIIDLYNEYYEN